jgi:hypothetical protein
LQYASQDAARNGAGHCLQPSVVGAQVLPKQGFLAQSLWQRWDQMFTVDVCLLLLAPHTLNGQAMVWPLQIPGAALGGACRGRG